MENRSVIGDYIGNVFGLPFKAREVAVGPPQTSRGLPEGCVRPEEFRSAITLGNGDVIEGPPVKRVWVQVSPPNLVFEFQPLTASFTMTVVSVRLLFPDGTPCTPPVIPCGSTTLPAFDDLTIKFGVALPL